MGVDDKELIIFVNDGPDRFIWLLPLLELPNNPCCIAACCIAIMLYIHHKLESLEKQVRNQCLRWRKWMLIQMMEQLHISGNSPSEEVTLAFQVWNVMPQNQETTRFLIHWRSVLIPTQTTAKYPYRSENCPGLWCRHDHITFSVRLSCGRPGYLCHGKQLA